MNTSFYTVEPTNVKVAGVNFSYPKVKPTNGNINIFQDFKWKNDGSVEEVPYLTLSEYELSYGIWTNNLLRIINNVNTVAGGKTVSDPYGTLYFGKPTGFTYTLPYLIKPGNSIRGEVNNIWGGLGNTTSQMIGAIPGVGGMAKRGYDFLEKQVENVANFVTPGYGAEEVMGYKSTAPRSFTVSFPLYNTISPEEAIKNFNFVNLLTMQTTKTKTTYLTYIPPKIYVVDTYSMGGLYMPAAYISKYDFVSIGTTRRISDYGTTGVGSNDIIIPEAYKVSITLTELLPQSSNTIWGGLGGSKTQVIDGGAPIPTPNNTINAPFNVLNAPQRNIPGGDVQITANTQPNNNLNGLGLGSRFTQLGSGLTNR